MPGARGVSVHAPVVEAPPTHYDAVSAASKYPELGFWAFVRPRGSRFKADSCGWSYAEYIVAHKSG